MCLGEQQQKGHDQVPGGMWEIQMVSRLLASVWPSPRHWGILRSEEADGTHCPDPPIPFLSIALPLKEINLLFEK